MMKILNPKTNLILFFGGKFYPFEDQVIHALGCNDPLGD